MSSGNRFFHIFTSPSSSSVLHLLCISQKELMRWWLSPSRGAERQVLMATEDEGFPAVIYIEPEGLRRLQGSARSTTRAEREASALVDHAPGVGGYMGLQD
jgi:hypothetical protein